MAQLAYGEIEIDRCRIRDHANCGLGQSTSELAEKKEDEDRLLVIPKVSNRPAEQRVEVT